MSTPSIAERVAAGVAWLDSNEPGWFRQIHVAGLDMSTCRRCVMGQIHGDYEDSPMDGDDDLAISLGFLSHIERDGPADLRDSERAEMDAEYDALTAEWRRVIQERRQAAGATP